MPIQRPLKHLEAPSRASIETSLGPRGSPGTLQERSRGFLKGPKRQKRSPKLTKGQPGVVKTSPRRSKKTGRDMKVGHQAPKAAQNLPPHLWKLLQEPPGQQASSRKFHLSYRVPSKISDRWCERHQTGPPSIEASKPPVASAGCAKRKQL